MKRRIASALAVAFALTVLNAPIASAVGEVCAATDGTLEITEPGDYPLTLQMSDGVLLVDHSLGGVCQNREFDPAPAGDDFDTVVVEQDGAVTFLLNDVGNDDEVADWADLAFDVTVMSDDGIFDASDVDDNVGVSVEIASRGGFGIKGADGDIDVAGVIVLLGSDQGDTLDAATYDGAVVADGGDDDDVLYGGDGDDELVCLGDGDDECWGGDGDDALTIGRGDTAAPGDGDDDIDAGYADGDWTLTYEDSSDGIAYDKQEDDYVRSDAGDDRLDGEAPDTIVGSEFEDEIFGDDTADTVYGGGGDDLIRGREGDDRIYGEDGDDTLYGGRDADGISGGYGDDELFGRHGNDDLRGDAGIDRITGGADRDTCSAEFESTCEW